MAKRIATARRHCRSMHKRRYTSAGAAVRGASARYGEKMTRDDVYACPRCGGWHVTSRRREESKLKLALDELVDVAIGAKK